MFPPRTASSIQKSYSGPHFLTLLGLGALFLLAAACENASPEGNYLSHPTEWRSYLGGPDRNHYSASTQLTPDNVKNLEVAWTYQTGDALEGGRSQVQCNPLMVDGVLYGASPQIKAFALDAQTGAERWRFDPFAERGENDALGVNRGLSYWEKGKDKRILFSAGEFLYALDAHTGKPISSFGEGGKVSLKSGLGKRAEDLFVVSNAPGAIFENLIIMGSRVSEFTDAAPGYIQAFDVRTGELAWVFHTIPLPGEFGHETWPEDAWSRLGGANAWAGMSLDHERGMVFVPTGSAAFDFYGGNRKGANLFANCLLALDARTGKRIWHYQTTHHDIWDRDLPCPSNLVSLKINGEMKDAVVQPTKQGLIFVLDRETGEPLFPVREEKMAASTLEGEEAWPTQPIPQIPPPFARRLLDESVLTRRSPEAHEAVKKRFSKLKGQADYTPGSLEGSIIFPGFDGGGEWGGASFDPENGYLYINSNEMAWILTMVEVKQEKNPNNKVDVGRNVYLTNCASCHGQSLEGGGGGMGVYPALTGLADRMKEKDFRQLLVKGRGVMPSYKHLKEEQVRDLVSFLLDKAAEPGEVVGKEGEAPSNSYLPYAHTGYHKFLDPDGFPAVSPPWGKMTAYDLANGSIAWQKPLGRHPGLPEINGEDTGCENYGGSVVSKGGLLFIAATQDGYIRALDKQSGKELWRHELPAGGFATPSLYEVEGKAYLVIACGGGKMGLPSGDSYVAFALPD